MTALLRPILHILIVTLALGFAAKTAKAQDSGSLDPVVVDPEHYKVLFENEVIRVLSYDDTPGHFVPKHHHPEFVVYALAPAVRKFFTGDCKNRSTPPVKIPAFIPIVKDPVTHCEINAGKTDDHFIIIEFKEGAKTEQGAGAPKRRHHKRSKRQ